MKLFSHTCKRLHTSCMAVLTAAVLSLFPMPIAAQGAVSQSAIPGDVNDDGEVTVIDVIVMQGWLLGHDNVTMYAPQNADIDGDGVADVFDLGLMKRILLGNGTAIPITPTEPTDPKTPTEPVSGGKLYQKIALSDQYAGVKAFEGILPEGWTVNMTSNGSCVGEYCGQELVTFTSPDEKAVVQIASAREYKQTTGRSSGVDLSEFTTFYPYHNAEAVIENIIDSAYPGAELVKEIEIPEQQQNDVTAIAYWKAMNLAQYIQQSRMNWEVVGYEGTVSRRQYKLDDYRMEYCCAVPAIEYKMYGIGVSTTDHVDWTTQNTVGFEAVDAETFDKYYSDYEMITANSYFTDDFYSVVSYVTGRIVLAIAQNLYTESTGSEAAQDYSSSGIEITDSDRETQERVFQAWDDYIKDEDRYTTTDGSQLTTSMFNETVAQDGDKFYVGDRTDIPFGFTELTKQ